MYSNNQLAVLKCLVYFSIFNYPLKKEEVKQFCSISISDLELDTALDELVNSGSIKTEKKFYFLNSQSNTSVNERITNNANANNVLKKVTRYVKLIHQFPFVRGVCISGSYSKNVFTKNGDIDYFIICAKNRIWLCRSLLIIFKKIVLFNSKKYFCVNYFIDETNLQIPDKNVYTATELATLLPGTNYSLYLNLLNQNNWYKTSLPNFTSLKSEAICEPKNRFIKQLLEKIFKNKLGDYLETKFFKLSITKWHKKFPNLTKQEFELNMRSSNSTSKHHPQGFQFKVLKLYEEGVKTILNHTLS